MNSPENNHDPVRTWTDESLPMQTRRELLAKEVEALGRRRKDRAKNSGQPTEDSGSTGDHPG